jgi:hypothetical protein
MLMDSERYNPASSCDFTLQALHDNMADKGPNTAEYAGEKILTEDGRKIVEETEVEGVNTSFATIMAKHKPNPWGKGHLRLYALAAICFLNSTMSGK